MPTDAYDDIGDDDLVPLAKACKIFLHGHLTKSSLRREHSRGNLEIIRIANKDFVTRNIVRRMIERCTVRTDQEPSKPVATRPMDRQSGGSAHEALKSMLAQNRQDRGDGAAAGSPRAAAKARLKQLRDSLPKVRGEDSAEPPSPALAKLKQLREKAPATNPQTSRHATRKKGDEH